MTIWINFVGAEMLMLHKHIVSGKSRSLHRGLSLEVSWKFEASGPISFSIFFLGVDIVTHVYGKCVAPFVCHSPDP